jgi:hypothetical protein
MLGQLQEFRPPEQGQKCVLPQKFFDVQPPHSRDLSPLDFYLWRHLETLVYSGPVENEETLHQRIFMRVKPFSIAPGALEGRNTP